MYQPEPATEKQFKYFKFLCRGSKEKGGKNMTAPEMGRVENKFIRRFKKLNKKVGIEQKLWSWSDINKDQMMIAIDLVTRFYESSYKEFVKNSSYQFK